MSYFKLKNKNLEFRCDGCKRIMFKTYSHQENMELSFFCGPCGSEKNLQAHCAACRFVLSECRCD